MCHLSKIHNHPSALVMPFKQLGLGHCVFAIHYQNHLQHFHHQISQFLTKFDVSLLLGVINPFPHFKIFHTPHFIWDLTYH